MSQVEIIFWNVDHGHATYLRSPNGRHIVIDLGTGCLNNNKEFSPLSYLRMHNVPVLDYVIITHPHLDHIDDIFQFNKMTPKVFLHPSHLDKKKILEKADDKNRLKLEHYFEISENYCKPVDKDGKDNPKNALNWGGLRIKTFAPSACSQNNINNHSIVTVFSFEGVKILIPGDNEASSWEELNKMEGFLEESENVDVLLAPHHGRENGFDSETIRHFNPRLTVISDGAFCDTSATDRYRAFSRGWEVFDKNGKSSERFCVSTRKDGTITITFGVNESGNSFLNVRTGIQYVT